MQRGDMIEILAWLFQAAHLSKPPLDNQPEVGDNEYLLFPLLLNTHLSKKGHSQANEDPVAAMAKMVTELGILMHEAVPAEIFVNRFDSLGVSLGS
jgi:hypothetical protein